MFSFGKRIYDNINKHSYGSFYNKTYLQIARIEKRHNLG